MWLRIWCARQALKRPLPSETASGTWRLISQRNSDAASIRAKCSRPTQRPSRTSSARPLARDRIHRTLPRTGDKERLVLIHDQEVGFPTRARKSLNALRADTRRP
jgi:hypothetical protein